MAKHLYSVRQNPQTKELICNEEQFCPGCFKNFGDWQILAAHRIKRREERSLCLDPIRVGLVAKRNIANAIVWWFEE